MSTSLAYGRHARVFVSFRCIWRSARVRSACDTDRVSGLPRQSPLCSECWANSAILLFLLFYCDSRLQGACAVCIVTWLSDAMQSHPCIFYSALCQFYGKSVFMYWSIDVNAYMCARLSINTSTNKQLILYSAIAIIYCAQKLSHLLKQYLKILNYYAGKWWSNRPCQTLSLHYPYLTSISVLYQTFHYLESFLSKVVPINLKNLNTSRCLSHIHTYISFFFFKFS